MKTKTIGLLLMLLLSMIFVASNTVATTSEKPVIKGKFQEKVWDRVNNSYVDAQGVTAGNTQAMVAWGSSNTTGSLMAAIQHRIPIGIAEIHAKNGTYAIPLVSWGYMAIIYDFVGEVNRTINGTPQLVKQVNLHHADWDVSYSKISETDTTVEYQLTAITSTPYENSTLPAPTIKITFHLYANYTELNNATQKVFVIERNDDGEITIAKEDRNVTVPVTRVAVKFKMDYEISGWQPASNDSKIILGFRLGIFESHSLLVNRLFHALKRQNSTITAPEEFKSNRDLQRPIFFRDISKLPKRFGWVPTAQVDGQDSNVLVRFWNIKSTFFRYSTDNNFRFVGKGLMGSGAFIYNAGNTIIHDPDMQVFSEDISAQAAASIIQEAQSKTKALPFLELAITLGAILILIPIINRRK